MRALLVAAAVAAATLGPAPTADARTTFPEVIPLPNGFFPEGIAVGRGTTFYAGSLAGGAVYRGDLRTGAGEVLVPATEGGVAVGVEVDRRERVWVAGGDSGTGRVYDGTTGELVASYDFAPAGEAFVNDVVVTPDAAYFTDSLQTRLFVVPLSPNADPGDAVPRVLPVTGLPAVGFPNLNGIETLPGGDALVVAHTSAQALYRVDPLTGAADRVDLGGAALPNGDGLYRSGTTLYVVQNFLNQVAVIDLAPDGTSGVVSSTLTDGDLDVPTTAGRFGDALYAVNARFSTPPGPDVAYDVVRVALH
jgi:sugar lactone lactonase YvrE